MPLSPGIGYLATQLPRILAPPLLVYCAKLVTELRLGIIVPTWLTTLACVLSGPAVLTVVVQYRDYQNRRQAAAHGAIIPPAIPGSIGGLSMLFANVADMYPAEPLAAVASELGKYTLTIRFLFQNRIMTAEPDNIKAILATEFDAFEKGSEFRGLMEPLLGTGMTRPFFHRERISDFDLFDHHATKAIAQFKARLREGYAADFQDMVARFTMDTSSSFLFGKDIRSLDAGLPYPYNVTIDAANAPAVHLSSVFATAFQEAQTITSLRSRFGEHWPLREFWVDELEKPMRIVREFLDPILEEAVARMRATGQAIQEKDKTNELGDRQVQEGESLLDHLVNYTDDYTILRDELLNLTAAGRDTTAGLLTFTIYMLAEHPEVLTKLREEIFRFVGPTTRPTYDNFRDMKYLRAVLNGEKYPSNVYAFILPSYAIYSSIIYSPFNVRTALQPILFRSSNNGPPLFVPAGTRCVFSTILMHRRKDLWGPDALEFDPERFLDERLHKYLTPNPFIFLPFNGGPRICLGQQFAYHEASFFLVRLLQTFSSVSLDLDAQPPAARPPLSWKTNDKSGWTAHEKIRPRSHLTMFVFGGLWVRMEEADAIAEGEVKTV
ncbi:Cytochrome P450 [Mycena sanguinolenta]|uniref:Cytochrome P450 n=1 Tax=Mycena sanguinolenta TaxID=230812 RepID=A0A8H7CWW1_9AGAR|nr:Cytochrome P450 [Mycena sanguinolenta]